MVQKRIGQADEQPILKQKNRSMTKKSKFVYVLVYITPYLPQQELKKRTGKQKKVPCVPAQLSRKKGPLCPSTAEQNPTQSI